MDNETSQVLNELQPYWGKFIADPRVPKGEIRMGSWDGPTLVKNIGTEGPEPWTKEERSI